MHVEIFTDGSCIKNCGQKEAIAGYGVYFPNGELENVSRPFLHKPITNQRAELYAIYVAIFKVVHHLDVDRMIIYSDSEYSIKSLTLWLPDWIRRGWRKADRKKVENQDLLKLIHRLMEQFGGEIKFIHVRSHTGKKDYMSLGNAEADKLAVEGAKKNVQQNKKQSRSKPKKSRPKKASRSKTTKPKKSRPKKSKPKKISRPTRRAKRRSVIKIDTGSKSRERSSQKNGSRKLSFQLGHKRLTKKKIRVSINGDKNHSQSPKNMEDGQILVRIGGRRWKKKRTIKIDI